MIDVTSFGWLFLPIGCVLLAFRPTWLLALVATSAVIQSPAVITVAVGDSGYGITPFNAATALIGLHVLALWRHRDKSPSWPDAYLWWSLFFVTSALGALILPHVFEGVPVHPALVRGVTLVAPEPNRWSVSNLAQAINCIGLWLVFTHALLLPDRQKALRVLSAGLAAGFALSVLAGLYQRLATWGIFDLHTSFWASNPGYNQWFHAPEYGPRSFVRAALPFIEPSYASVWFAAVLCGAATVVVYARSHRGVALVVSALAGIGMLNTLGTTGMLATTTYALALSLFHALVGWRWTDQTTNRLLALCSLAGAFVAVFLLVDYAALRSEWLIPMRDAFDWTWTKLAAYPGSERDHTNRHALQIVLDTYGVGAGAGSSRASGYFNSLVANTGIPGLALFLAALASQVRASGACVAGRDPLALALLGMLIGALLGVGLGIADQNWPVLWVVLLGGMLTTSWHTPPRDDAARSLKILLLTQWFDPEPTFKGQAFARALREAGHEVDVVTGFPNYPGGRVYPGYKIRWRTRETMDGVRVFRVALYPSHDRSAIGRVLNYVSFAASATLYSVVCLRRPDVVYCYHPPLTSGMAGVLIGKLKRVPVVIDIQDLWPDTLHATGMLRSPTALALVGGACKAVYSLSSAIVVLSPGFQRALIDRGVQASKVEVIYNWCDELAIAAESASRVPAAMVGRFNIVFAGTMGKAQALDSVLEAAALAAGENPSLQFVFVGGGIDVERLIARSEKLRLGNVLFVPRLPMNEVGAILRAGDALLVHLKDDPLFAITVPSKTQAYMATGRPIIMAVRGDAADLVLRAGAGVTAVPENPRSIADAALYLAALTPEQRSEMGTSGARFYRETMSLESGVRAFQTTFRRMARR